MKANSASKLLLRTKEISFSPTLCMSTASPEKEGKHSVEIATFFSQLDLRKIHFD